MKLNPVALNIGLARKAIKRSDLHRSMGGTLSLPSINKAFKGGNVIPKTAGLIANALGVDVETLLMPDEREPKPTEAPNEAGHPSGECSVGSVI